MFTENRRDVDSSVFELFMTVNIHILILCAMKLCSLDRWVPTLRSKILPPSSEYLEIPIFHLPSQQTPFILQSVLTNLKSNERGMLSITILSRHLHKLFTRIGGYDVDQCRTDYSKH
jgi:hypothetical protein